MAPPVRRTGMRAALLFLLLAAGCHSRFPPVDSGPTIYTEGTVETGGGRGSTGCDETVACSDCVSGEATCSVFDCYGQVTSTYTAECQCTTEDWCDGCAEDGTELCHVIDNCTGYEVDSYYVSC